MELDGKPHGDIVIQPTNFMKGVLIPNMLCPGEKIVPIMMRNPSKDYKTLNKGSPFGIGIEALEKIAVSAEEETFDIRKIDVWFLGTK